MHPINKSNKKNNIRVSMKTQVEINGMCVVEGNSNCFARPGYYYQCDSLSSKVEESHN